MKRSLWISLVAAGICQVGCGGKDESSVAAGGITPPAAEASLSSVPAMPGGLPTSVGPAAAAPTAESALDKMVPLTSLNLTSPTRPEEVVGAFLDGMRTGNAKVIESLLSTRARQEIVDKGLDIAPIGSPQARFEIGVAQLADPKDPNTVLVSSNWYEPGADGQIAGQYEVVWALIKETTGWRICEMAVDTHQEGEEIQVVNFENLSDLAPKDSTSAPPAGPATSANPANEPARTASLPGSTPATAVPPSPSSSGLPPLPPSNLPALPGGNAGPSGLPAIPSGSFPAGSAGGVGGSGSLPPLPPAGFGGGSK